MNPKDYFLNILNINHVFYPSNSSESFYEFSYRFNSIYRNWILFKDYNKTHLDLLKQAEMVDDEYDWEK